MEEVNKMGRSKYLSHDFYCMNCGNRSMPLPRKKGQERERLHRKKLYCLYCKEEVNHIECRTMEEVEEFKINFAEGVYKNEAEESLDHVRSTRLGQINICPKGNRKKSRNTLLTR